MPLLLKIIVKNTLIGAYPCHKILHNQMEKLLPEALDKLSNSILEDLNQRWDIVLDFSVKAQLF